MTSLGFSGLIKRSLNPRLKLLIVAVIIGAFTIESLRILISAYPVITHGSQAPNNYRLDFGVYYNAAWRLVHNPGQMYNQSSVPGDYLSGALATNFKYLPFFPVFILPLLLLNYTSAIITWDVFQLLLMPVIGFLIYRAQKNYNVVVIVAVVWIALLQPIPIPPNYTVSFYDLYHSQSYYWQWAEGNAKVLMTFLVVTAYYFSKSKKPYFAGLAYGLAFFDPRFPLYAIPLFLIVNRGQYRNFLLATGVTLVAGDLILLYDGLGSSFVGMISSIGVETPFYAYAWIPFYTIVALTVVEGVNFLYRGWLARTKSGVGSPLPTTAQGLDRKVTGS